MLETSIPVTTTMPNESNSEPENERSSSQLKELRMVTARKGTFNQNPLLSTTHTITCQHCQHSQSIVYLNSLKSGAFEVGKAEEIEVLDSSMPIESSEMEKVTPIIINFVCKKCSYCMEVRPVSVEYLQTLNDRPKPSGAMYV